MQARAEPRRAGARASFARTRAPNPWSGTVVGVFPTRREAQRARARLTEAGYRQVRVAVVRPPSGRLARLRSRALASTPRLLRGAVLGTLMGFVIGVFLVASGQRAASLLAVVISGTAVVGALFAVTSDLRRRRHTIVVARVRSPRRREDARFLLRVEGAIETRCGPGDQQLRAFAPGFAEVAPLIRTTWSARRDHDGGGGWQEHEPHCRFGWQLANRPDFAERSWSDALGEIRTEWRMRHPRIAWGDVAAEVLLGWEAARQQPGRIAIRAKGI